MSPISRRTFGKSTLGSLLTFSLLDTLYATNAWSDEIRPLAAKFFKEVNDLSKDLKGAKLEQLQWQTKMEELMSQVDLADMLKFIDFETLTKNLQYRERGERAIQKKLPAVEGLPTNLVFGHQIFALQKGRSVVPHGHNNMATSFLILKGDFYGRHYDRVEDADDFMIIKPTIDRAFTTAEYSTISDHKDNVHWFTATSETAFIFNIHVLNLDPENRRGGRVYVDPEGESLAGGQIKGAETEVSRRPQEVRLVGIV